MHVDSRTGIQIIDRRECLELLAGDSVGRLAINEGDAPLVLPVNYGVEGERVIIRTASGSKLDAVHRMVCFEIDHVDRSDHSGWSVVVRGRLEEIDPVDRERWERLRLLPQPWADGEKDHILWIEPVVISGRRLPARP